MMTDPIADMLTRIRNAQMSKKHSVRVPLSKVKNAIANLLSAEGYVGKIEKIDGIPSYLVLELKCNDGTAAITSIKRESKPGHRVYRKSEEMPFVLNGYGIAVVSTSQGIITAKEAKKKGIGGEILCSVY